MHTGRIVADASPVEMKRQVENEAGVMLDVGTDKPLISMDLWKKPILGAFPIWKPYSPIGQRTPNSH